MAEDGNRTGISLGIWGRRQDGLRLTAAEAIAAALSALWLAGAGLAVLIADMPAEGGAAFGLMALVAIVLPVALIWVAALAARAARDARAEAARLQAAIDALRQAYVIQSQTGRPAGRRPGVEAPAANGPAPAPTLAPAPSDPQQSLALAPPEPVRDPLSVDEFILALNFPDDENDRGGFRVLRRALEDREAGKLVRASQDVLTLLSHDGVYMDDLKPDRARPEIWRRFAAGERGRAVAALGGVRDRSALALTAQRMREDVIFRDAAHHFLRHFDHTISPFLEHATDQEIADLGETRTARAFMLLARVTGTFD